MKDVNQGSMDMLALVKHSDMKSVHHMPFNNEWKSKGTLVTPERCRTVPQESIDLQALRLWDSKESYHACEWYFPASGFSRRKFFPR